jgi:hypothetical protein
MKKSIGSKSLRIYLRFAVFALMLIGASFADAQNLAKRRSPPSPKSDGPPELPPYDPDATSQHNRL